MSGVLEILQTIVCRILIVCACACALVRNLGHQPVIKFLVQCHTQGNFENLICIIFQYLPLCFTYI